MASRIILCRHPPTSLLLRTSPNLHGVSLHHSASPIPFSPLSLHSRSQFSKFHSPNPFSSLHSHNQFGPNFSFLGAGIDRLFYGADDHSSAHWNFSSQSAKTNAGSLAADKRPEVAVVLLGWLGAKSKHLKRYSEWYNARGLHSITFFSSVTDVLSLDLGKKLEKRIDRLTHDLTSWLSNGCDRSLIFHTFSNTGWLTYGAILGHLKGREDLKGRIKGCVVDSGGDPVIDPKVWASGFSAALLKKSSSATVSEKKEPHVIEAVVLFAFEKLFSFLLSLPDIKVRLDKVVSVLTEDQPACPQLYLYSSGDRVIPFERVEWFVEEQRRRGRKVVAFNFGSSPHVDHYRTFPDLYSCQLHHFLNDCSAVVPNC